MRMATRSAASLAMLGLVACGGGGGRRSPLSVTVSRPASDVVVSRGGTAAIAFTCDVPGFDATTRLVADVDGDPTTVADTFPIAAALPETGPTAQTVVWDTTGVPLGAYSVLAFADDGVHSTATAVAAGRVSLENVAYAMPTSVRTPEVAALPDGSSIVAGAFTGSATLGDAPTQTTLVAAGGASDADVVLTRYGPAGGLAWARRAGGVNPDRCDAASAGLDGSLSVAGMFRTEATYGPGESGETTLTGGLFDLYVGSYAADGSLTWVRRIVVVGPSGLAFVTSIARYADGSCAVAGSLHGSATFGTGEPGQVTLSSNEAPDDAFVARYRSDGSLAWARIFGGTLADSANGVAATDDGGAVVTGHYRGTTTFGAGEPGETTFTTAETALFVAAFSPTGSLSWVRRATESAASSRAAGVRVATAPGGFLVLGSAIGTVAFDPGTASETPLVAASPMGDSFVARYGTDGSLAWVRRVETGPSFPGAVGVAALGDGGYVVGGSVTGTTTLGPDAGNALTIASTSPASADVYVARFAADGSVRWARTAGGSGAEAFAGLALFVDGSIAVTGTFRASATFGAGDPRETLLTTAASAGETFVARFNADGGF